MKKMLAMMCALALCCTAFAACSSVDDSSETKPAQTTTTPAEVSEEPAETESQADVVPTPDETIPEIDITTGDEVVEFEYDGELFSETYTEKLLEGHFSLTASVESEMLGEMGTTESIIECAGIDFHQKTIYGDMSSDMYLYDKNLYILYEDTKTYTVMDYSEYISEDPSANASMALGLTDELVLTNRTVNDEGLIVEEYTYNSPYLSAADFTDGQLPKYIYYFKDNGDIVKVEVTFNGSVQTYNITAVDFDIKEITLPDLSDWTLDDNGMGLGADGKEDGEDDGAESEAEDGQETEEIVP